MSTVTRGEPAKVTRRVIQARFARRFQRRESKYTRNRGDRFGSAGGISATRGTDGSPTCASRGRVYGPRAASHALRTFRLAGHDACVATASGYVSGVRDRDALSGMHRRMRRCVERSAQAVFHRRPRLKAARRPRSASASRDVGRRIYAKIIEFHISMTVARTTSRRKERDSNISICRGEDRAWAAVEGSTRATRPVPHYPRIMHANVIPHKIYQRVHARELLSTGRFNCGTAA